MADVKITLTGSELIELRAVLGWDSDKLTITQAEAMLSSIGYDFRTIALCDQVKVIAERLLARLQ